MFAVLAVFGNYKEDLKHGVIGAHLIHVLEKTPFKQARASASPDKNDVNYEDEFGLRRRVWTTRLARSW